MDTEKIKTLVQVHDALEIVENARADQGVNANEKFELELAAFKLRNLERSIIKLKQNELLTSLTADSVALLTLSEEIKKSSDKLSSVAFAIEKAAKVVEAFVSFVTKVTAAGFL